MVEIKFKNENREPSQLVKNLGVVLFNYFANFFNWFVIFVCLFILVAGYWWLVKPKYDFIASDQELAFREKEYEDKVTYLKQLTEIKNLYKAIGQSDKDKIDIMLSANQDLDRLKIILLRAINKVGKEQSLAIDNIVITPLDNSKEKFIKIGQEPKNNPLLDKLQLVQISFMVKGVNYEGFKKFLARLEKSLQIMDIRTITFDPKASTVSVELTTYYLQH